MTRAGLALLCLLAAAGPAVAEEPKTSSQAAEKLGLKFSPNAELVITSDEAEGVKGQDGRESVVFQKRVKARQGDMQLECDWLQAVYPQTAGNRPDKISAKGGVVITQGTNEARCSEASIDNVACTAECRSSGGKAILRRGTDDVEADAIYFDLCKGTVKAVGGVQIRVKEKPQDGPAPQPPPVATPPVGDGG